MRVARAVVRLASTLDGPGLYGAGDLRPRYRLAFTALRALNSHRATVAIHPGGIMNVQSKGSALRWYLTALATVLALAISLVHPKLVAAGTITTLSSTIPSNGDINPYGVFRIPHTTGKLRAGNILVSNFNNFKNQQGTGTTLVEISPSGAFMQFAKIEASRLPGSCPGGVGLTTALVVLQSGWVIVGSLPTADGTSQTAKAGCLLVLDSNGHVVRTITDP